MVAQASCRFEGLTKHKPNLYVEACLYCVSDHDGLLYSLKSFHWKMWSAHKTHHVTSLLACAAQKRSNVEEL